MRKSLGITKDVNGIRIEKEEKRGKYKVTIVPIIHIDRNPAHDRFGAQIEIRF